MLQCYQYSSVSGSNTSSVNTTIVQSCLNNLPEESKNNYQSMVLQSKNRISSSSCVYNNIPSSLHFLDQVTHWIIITFNFKLLNLRNIEKFVEHYWICFRCPLQRMLLWWCHLSQFTKTTFKMPKFYICNESPKFVCIEKRFYLG